MSRGKPWTNTEQEHLQAHYGSIATSRLQSLLNERTAKAIRDKAMKLGLGKCPERLAEMGRENVGIRWNRVLREPDTPQT